MGITISSGIRVALDQSKINHEIIVITCKSVPINSLATGWSNRNSVNFLGKIQDFGPLYILILKGGDFSYFVTLDILFRAGL